MDWAEPGRSDPARPGKLRGEPGPGQSRPGRGRSGSPDEPASTPTHGQPSPIHRARSARRPVQRFSERCFSERVRSQKQKGALTLPGREAWRAPRTPDRLQARENGRAPARGSPQNPREGPWLDRLAGRKVRRWSRAPSARILLRPAKQTTRRSRPTQGDGPPSEPRPVTITVRRLGPKRLMSND